MPSYSLNQLETAISLMMPLFEGGLIWNWQQFCCKKKA